MALSNAERQKLHRDRVKARLAAGEADIGNRLFRAVTDYLSDPAFAFDQANSVEEWFEEFYRQSQGAAAEALIPVVYDALSLPADPWPGLTAEELKRMIGRRMSAGAVSCLASGPIKFSPRLRSSWR